MANLPASRPCSEEAGSQGSQPLGAFQKRDRKIHDVGGLRMLGVHEFQERASLRGEDLNIGKARKLSQGSQSLP